MKKLTNTKTQKEIEEIVKKFIKSFYHVDDEEIHGSHSFGFTKDKLVDFLASYTEQLRAERDKEIATLIKNTVFQHTTPELEKKLSIKHLRNIVQALSPTEQGEGK